MLNHFRFLLPFVGFIVLPTHAAIAALPSDFVYLQEIDPSIQQEIRYATAHNFIGKPIPGYKTATCILTKPAAVALSHVQKTLKKSGLSLKVYDCYRPQQAVDAFVTWSKQPQTQRMKAEFYPHVEKADLFKLGYIAEKSGHTRGSTVDITIVSLPKKHTKAKEIEMGTPYDYLDPLSHNDNTSVSDAAQHNRQFFKTQMEQAGFTAYQPEWWHFTLKEEPYPDTYFNFPIYRP